VFDNQLIRLISNGFNIFLIYIFDLQLTEICEKLRIAIMIFSNRTYRKSISISILSAYILVSIFSLLHFHHVDLNRPNSISNSTNSTLTGLGTFDGQNFLCTIHQNFSLLHNTSRVDIADNSPDLQNSDNITVFKNECYHSPFKFNNIRLRAPPISS
jgi:hypothetical protein